jgi:hypothetical protein
MEAPSGDTEPERAAELAIAIATFTNTLRAASTIYSGSPAEQARGAIKIALHGVVTLISNLYPNEPAFPRPLNDLLYHLHDLDHGAVAVLKPTKVSSRPSLALSEELFRAIVAAAMTSLMNGGKKKKEAARDIARRLAKVGGKSASGEIIQAGQIEKWREKMMTERAAENKGVARYQEALEILSGMEPNEAVDLMLSSLTDLSPANFPKKPPA